MGRLLIPSWTIRFNWVGQTGSGQFCVNILTPHIQYIALFKDMDETRYRFTSVLPSTKNQFDPCRMGLDVNIQGFPASLKKRGYDMVRW